MNQPGQSGEGETTEVNPEQKAGPSSAADADGESRSDLKRALFAVSDGVLGAGVLVFIGVLGGNWLDARFNSAPWCSLTLSLLGGAIGLWRLIAKATSIKFSSAKPRRKPGSKGKGASAKNIAAESSGETGPRSTWEKWQDYDDQ